MNIAQVLYVLEVAKYHNFSKAADSLFISQPALSQQIIKLERELGAPLFERTSSGALLTNAGERFCAAAEKLAECWEELQQSVKPTGEPIRHLRIGLGTRAFSNKLFEPIVAYFDARPDLKVSFLTDISGSILDELESGLLDLAIDRLPPQKLMEHADHFYICDLIQERQCILMSKEDPRSRKASISFRELQGCTIVTGEEGSMEDKIMQQDCRDYGITLKRSYRSDNITTIMKLVHSGKGIVIGPSSFSEYFDVAAVPMRPEVYVGLSFVCLKENRNDPQISAFREELLAMCGSMQ